MYTLSVGIRLPEFPLVNVIYLFMLMRRHGR